MSCRKRQVRGIKLSEFGYNDSDQKDSDSDPEFLPGKGELELLGNDSDDKNVHMSDISETGEAVLMYDLWVEVSVLIYEL